MNIDYQLSAAARACGCGPGEMRRLERYGHITFRRVLGQRVLNDEEIETVRRLRATLRRGRPRKQRTENAIE